jgi:hypothetical protein
MAGDQPIAYHHHPYAHAHSMSPSSNGQSRVLDDHPSQDSGTGRLHPRAQPDPKGIVRGVVRSVSPSSQRHRWYRRCNMVGDEIGACRCHPNTRAHPTTPPSNGQGRVLDDHPSQDSGKDRLHPTAKADPKAIARGAGRAITPSVPRHPRRRYRRYVMRQMANGSAGTQAKAEKTGLGHQGAQ